MEKLLPVSSNILLRKCPTNSFFLYCRKTKTRISNILKLWVDSKAIN